VQSIGALCEISTSNIFFYIFLPSITLKPEHTYANFVSSVRASTGGAVNRIHGEVVLPLHTPHQAVSTTARFSSYPRSRRSSPAPLELFSAMEELSCMLSSSHYKHSPPILLSQASPVLPSRSLPSSSNPWCWRGRRDNFVKYNEYKICVLYFSKYVCAAHIFY